MAPHHGIKLALAGQLRQITGVLCKDACAHATSPVLAHFSCCTLRHHIMVHANAKPDGTYTASALALVT
jgi:hypothetical protein